MTSCGHPEQCLVLHDGEFVCGRCGAVDELTTGMFREQVNSDAARASSATDHHPVNHELIIPLGSQHNFVSPGNQGLCMDLNNPRGKDFQGKKIHPQLSLPYAVGQIVGKGSVAIDRPDGSIGAKKSFFDDTIYRGAKQKSNGLASKLDLDVVTRKYYGKQVDSEFSKFVNLAEEFLALKALFELAAECSGLGITVPNEMVKQYDVLMEKLRLFTQEPFQKAQLVTA
jgi:hypothetical protein